MGIWAALSEVGSQKIVDRAVVFRLRQIIKAQLIAHVIGDERFALIFTHIDVGIAGYEAGSNFLALLSSKSNAYGEIMRSSLLGIRIGL